MPQALTVALLIPHIHNHTHGLQWLGALDACQVAGARLLTLPGGALRDPADFTAQANALYRLLSSEQIDALVIATSSLGVFVEQEELEAFCARFQPLPIVTFQTPLRDFPAIVTHEYEAMRSLLAHLVEVHGARRLAFIRGPERHLAFSERYRAFRAAVVSYQLPLDERLVTPPLHWLDGARAIEWLLDIQGLRPGRDFDAIVASSDTLALDALYALRARGIRVPDDLLVTGFDQNETPSADLPVLTTVRIPVYEAGQAAVLRALQLARGESIPQLTMVPARLIISESCGCLQSGLSVDEQESTTHPLAQGLAERLAAALKHDVISDSNTVLSLITETLRASADAELSLTLLQRAVGEARHHVLADLAPANTRVAEDLLHRARDILAEKERQNERYHRLQREQQAERLRSMGRLLNATAGLSEFMDVLATELPRLDVPAAALITFEPPPLSEPAPPLSHRPASLMMAYTPAGRLKLPPAGLPLGAVELLPSLLGDNSGFVVEPLFYRDEFLGYVTLATGPRDGALYDALGGQLRGALKGAQLYQGARAAQQAAEEADQLKSRFLSMVSHELRTPLNVIIGLSEMLAHSGAASDHLPMPLRQDLARLQISARQLDSLIRDVLDLARSQVGRLHLIRSPLDFLADVVEPVAAIGARLAAEKGLRWRFVPPVGPLPPILGDGPRLQQVLLNLVTNAVKFTTSGEVALRVDVVPGELQIQVSDTGLGIPPAEVEAIFDAFRQSERTATRGFGGIGIGLAIAREIVELHEGQISVRSPSAHIAGACFMVRLPVTGETAAEPPTHAGGSQPLVLLSEQHAPELCAQLAAQGMEVIELPVGSADSLARVVAANPEAIILDETAAAARGWELLATLKAHPALQDVPVFFAGLLLDQGRGALLSFDYRSKPMNAGALAEVLDREGLTHGDELPTILIADDDEATRDLHTRLIRTHAPNARIITAPDGRAALAVLEHVRPDLLLLDLMMPELDGFGVLEALQSSEQTRDIPVVVLSAQSLSDAEMGRLTRNVATVLRKGLFSALELGERIRGALTASRRSGGETRRLVRRAMVYIHDHYPDPISSDDIAEALAVSGRHLTRAFQQELGIPPLSYLNRYRIHQARTLLEDPEHTVADVALAVGFSDAAYFSRMFRREVGVAPRAYQQGERPDRGA